MSRQGWLTAGGLAVLLVASGVIAATTPTQPDLERPFLIEAELGEPTTARSILATVHSAVLADEISDASWASGDGSLWLLVDASVSATQTEDLLLGHAVLVVDGRTISASDRPRAATLRRIGLNVGIPTRGMLAFELPGDLLDEASDTHAQLQLAGSGDTRLDAVIVIDLPLAGLTHHRAATIPDSGWGRG